MGQGLGKNTPIILSLGKSNFEALISRHGQLVRWLSSRMCSCITDVDSQPDPDCDACDGSGWLYSFVTKTYEDVIAMAVDDTTIILPDSNKQDKVLQVYTKDGNIDFVQYDQYIKITGGKKGNYYNIRIEIDMTRSIDTVTLDSQTNIFVVGGVTIKPLISGLLLDGISYDDLCDILSVDSVTDANGLSLTVKELRQNSIVIADTEYVKPITAVGIKYLVPFKFALQQQNFSKLDSRAVMAAEGDALLTYPYSSNVSENDIITVLSGDVTEKQVVKKTDIDDSLPSFFVSEIVSITQKEVVYENGVDYILTGSNLIHWLTENKPLLDEFFSVVYKSNPTYTIIKSLPNLRTSEDQRQPKKSIIKLRSGYSEGDKINITGVL